MYLKTKSVNNLSTHYYYYYNYDFDKLIFMCQKEVAIFEIKQLF